MPLFEYQCRSCGLIFERLIRGKRGETHECRCGAVAEKRISKFGVSVQGEGFRKTDNASFDERVGADADKRREYYKTRHTKLREIQEANPGKKVALREDRSFVVVDP